MDHMLKIFAMKLALTVCISPIAGFIILKVAERFEMAWKTNNRRKRWFACCGVFFILACIAGWLR